MPHYADGTEAKVGDRVVIISITPGAESCNALVQFTQVVPRGGQPPRMALPNLMRIVKGEQHGNQGPESDVYTCADYTETKNLTKLI